MVLAAAVSVRNEVAVFIEESFLRALRLWCVVWRYEGGPNQKVPEAISMQPLVVDHATIPQMKAMDVPFYLVYGSLICIKGLQSDRPKC